MIAFDADILTEILAGSQALAARAARFSPLEQAVPVIVIEEILRGRLNGIRQAEAGKINLTIERAYELFEATLDAFRQVIVLPYSSAAETAYQSWRSLKTRVGTHDLRIAAICSVNSATLITRNQRDFAQIPGLSFEVWQ